MKCTCPCIDCIEGQHCGGDYTLDDGTLVGICRHLPYELGEILVDYENEYFEDYLREQRYLDWKESYNKNRSPMFHFRIPFLIVMWWDDCQWSISSGKSCLVAVHLGHIELLIG